MILQAMHRMRRLFGAAAAAACTAVVAPAHAAETASDLFNTRFCFACHSVARGEVKKLGPYLVDVAAKYGGRADARDHLIKSLLDGSQGVWGDSKVSVMPPNKITPEEAALLVPWVLQQK